MHKARAALDAQGNVIAYEFSSKAFSRVDVDTNGSKLFDTLAGQTLGVALKSGDGFGMPAESYEFANKKTSWETIPPLLDALVAAPHLASARSGGARRSISRASPSWTRSRPRPTRTRSSSG